MNNSGVIRRGGGPPMQIQACRGRTTGRGIILEHITSHTPVTPEGVGGYYIILYYIDDNYIKFSEH